MHPCKVIGMVTILIVAFILISLSTFLILRKENINEVSNPGNTTNKNSNLTSSYKSLIDEFNIKNISSSLDLNETILADIESYNYYETNNTNNTNVKVNNETTGMEKVNNTSIPSVNFNDCGVRYHGPEKNFVAHGAKVDPLDWPWLAVLYKLYGDGIEYHCVGSLVSRNKIITAAHCVVTSLPSQFVVFLSRFNTKLWGPNDESVAKEVTNIVIHPSYLEHKTKGADVAVLTLKHKTKYNQKIRPVCLFAHHLHQPYELQGSVVGWGKNEHYDYVTLEPRQVDLTIVDSRECIEYNKNFYHVVTNYKFCAANNTEGIGPCEGDSGGGFYTKRKTAEGQEIWGLRGVVSGSLKLADKDDCLDQKYFTFTDMEKQIGWIRDQIEVDTEDFTKEDEISEQERKNMTQECFTDLSKSKKRYVTEKASLDSRLYTIQTLIPTLIASKNKHAKHFQELKNTTALGHILKFLTHLKKQNNNTLFPSATIEKFAFILLNTKTNEKLRNIIYSEKERGKGSLIAQSVSSIEIANYLISSGGDPNYTSDKDDTPFLSAAFYGHLELVKFYIDKYHVNITRANQNGQNALHYSARAGHLNIVKYLVEDAKMDCNLQDNEGFTAAHHASIFNHFKIIFYLVENCKANVNLRNKKGETPLDLAVNEGFYEIIDYLEDKTSNDYNIFENPLHKAAFYGNLEGVKSLLRKNISVNIRDSHNQTALIWVSKSGYLDVFQYLAETAKADINLRDEFGYTVVHWSAFSGHLKILKYLVDKFNVDLIDRDLNGSTALHWAAEMGHLNVIKYLIRERKVDYDIEDFKGKTPFDFAKESYRGNVVDWFKKYERELYGYRI